MFLAASTFINYYKPLILQLINYYFILSQTNNQRVMKLRLNLN